MTTDIALSERDLPPRIAAAIEGARPVRDQQGCSACQVWRLDYAERPARYLKAGPADLARPVRGEGERLRWLAGRLPVPEVVAMESHGGWDYLVTTALPGVDMVAALDAYDHEHLIRLYAEGLRAVHAVPVEGCPFDLSPRRLAAEARANLESEDAGIKEQMAAWGVSRDAGLAAVRDVAAYADEPVFLHGDYCVPNLIVDGGRLAGFIDFDWAGVGDRHWDLAMARNSTKRNFGSDWYDLFLDIYGREGVDMGKIDRFVLLGAML